MTEPKRELILEALVAKLKTISPANGYWTQPKTVSRQRQDVALMDATNLPALFPVDGSETISPDHIGAAGRSVKSNFTTSIIGGIEDPTQTSTVLNRLKFDVLKAIFADTTLGGIARDIDWSTPITIEVDLGVNVSRAQFRLGVTYVYREDM